MYLFTGRVYALRTDKLRPAALSRVPSCADAKPKHFFCARDYTEPRFDGRQPGTISELWRNPEGYQEVVVNLLSGPGELSGPGDHKGSPLLWTIGGEQRFCGCLIIHC